MSFTPTIIINRKDLDKKADMLDKYYMMAQDSIEKKVAKYLDNIYKHHDVVKVDGVELLICEPELSGFNEEVRNKLAEWDVEYGISN